MYDITVTLGQGAIDYPGDPPWVVESLASLEAGDDYRLSKISMSAHAGTHLDFPAHFLVGGRVGSDYEIIRFFPTAHVVEIEGERIGPDALDGVSIKAGEAILFKTENSRSGLCRGGKWHTEYVSLTPEAAQRCVEAGCGIVGIDWPDIDPHEDRNFSAHRILLSNDIIILEGIDLGAVPPGCYRLACPPLKLGPTEASPVRAVLWEPGELEFGKVSPRTWS